MRLETKTIEQKIEQPVYSAGLEISSLPDTLNYLPNQNLDLSGLVIKKSMSDGTCVTLSDDEYTTEPENGILLSKIGIMPIKIISDNKTIFFVINVSETILTGIEITSMPTKIDYEEGGVFSPEGLGISGVLAVIFAIYIPEKIKWEQRYSQLLSDYRGYDFAVAVQGVIQFFTKDCKSDVERIFYE